MPKSTCEDASSKDNGRPFEGAAVACEILFVLAHYFHSRWNPSLGGATSFFSPKNGLCRTF